MEMIGVESTNIEAIGYDEDSGVLNIKFLSGALYEYYDVAQHVFDEFLCSSSKGSYANINIYKVYRQQKIG